MKEEWKTWEPVSDLSEKYYIESVSNDLKKGLKIVVCDEKNEKKKVIITFEYAISSYKWTNETFRLDTAAFLDEKYGKKFYTKWTFFKVTNSSYLQLLSKESSGIADYYSLIHFAIIESNSILDIIASYEPNVEFVEDK
ncbi:MAG: hypothetical protein A2Y40_10985 [Candidatus Margulisbacteria bacterium GWF2_35_9]|nr:MAG: hypothetical protein A2Y40_10985 [Candidatus Margulisbacteria bacterium GWF2_35_9]